MTGDSALATFGVMAADWITQQLTNAGEFEVVDPRSAEITRRAVDFIPRWFRDDDVAVALAEESEAGLLVTGRYYKERDSIHVHAVIVDVAGGRILRALPRAVVGGLRDEQRLVDRLALQVVSMAASEFDTSATANGLKRSMPASLAVYRETRAAWESYLAGDTVAFHLHAQQAAALDSSYMLPLAMQAHVHADSREWAQVDSLVRRMMPHRGSLADLDVAALDLMVARLAGDLDHQVQAAFEVMRAAPASPETRTHAARIAVNANRPRQALAAVAGVDPSRGVMLFVSWYWNWTTAAHHLLGQHDTELRAAETGARRLPRNIAALANRGRALAAHGRADDLHELLDDLAASSHDNARRWKVALDWTRELRAHGHESSAVGLLLAVRGDVEAALAAGDSSADWYLATIDGELLRWRESYARWETVAARHPTSMDALGHLAVAAARSGDVGRARRIEAQLAATRTPYAHGRDVMWRARIAAALGERVRALHLVEEALARGHARFIDPAGGVLDEPELHADPRLRELWPHPGFKALLVPRG
jgi:hypothetical protein